MKRILGLLGAVLGGWLGWWLGARLGFAVGLLLSVLIAGAGMYLAYRWYDEKAIRSLTSRGQKNGENLLIQQK